MTKVIVMRIMRNSAKKNNHEWSVKIKKKKR